MTDPNNIEDTSEDSQSYTYMVHHNSNIVGFYGSQEEADDALSGYQLGNDIKLDDTLEILKISQ